MKSAAVCALVSMFLLAGCVAESPDVGQESLDSTDGKTVVRNFAGTVVDAADIDAGDLSVTLHIECDDDKTGNCGMDTYEATLTEQDGGIGVAFDGVKFKLGSGDYWTSGWGRYFKATVRFAKKSDDKAFFNKHSVWGWERRPGSDLKYVWEVVEDYLSDMSFHKVEASHVDAGVLVRYPSSVGKLKETDDSKFQLVYNRQLSFGAGHDKMNAAVWLQYDVEPGEDVKLTMPTMYLAYYGDLPAMLGELQKVNNVVSIAHGPYQSDGKTTGFTGEHFETVQELLGSHTSKVELEIELQQQFQ